MERTDGRTGRLESGRLIQARPPRLVFAFASSNLSTGPARWPFLIEPVKYHRRGSADSYCAIELRPRKRLRAQQFKGCRRILRLAPPIGRRPRVAGLGSRAADLCQGNKLFHFQAEAANLAIKWIDFFEFMFREREQKKCSSLAFRLSLATVQLNNRRAPGDDHDHDHDDDVFLWLARWKK